MASPHVSDVSDKADFLKVIVTTQMKMNSKWKRKAKEFS